VRQGGDGAIIMDLRVESKRVLVPMLAAAAPRKRSRGSDIELFSAMHHYDSTMLDDIN